MKNPAARPYFLWDYDLTSDQVKSKLQTGSKYEKSWLLARILESARFDDVWHYTSLKQVRELFPHLKMRPELYKAWSRALAVWSN